MTEFNGQDVVQELFVLSQVSGKLIGSVSRSKTNVDKALKGVFKEL